MSVLVVWACKCRQWAEDGATRGEPGDTCLTCNSAIERIPVLRASAVEGLVAIGNRLSGYSQVYQYESADARREWREAVEKLDL